MVWFARTAIVLTGIAGGVLTSQAPEFTQQYRQRLGGALQELRAVVGDFDRDAEASNLSRQEALSAYSASSDNFLRDRGVSIGRTIHRYETLLRQQARFENWPEPTRPLALVGEVDTQLMRGAWKDYKPAVPVNLTGAIWAAVGLLLGMLLARLTGKVGRGVAGASRRRGMPATRQAQAAYHGEPYGDAPAVQPEREPVGTERPWR